MDLPLNQLARLERPIARAKHAYEWLYSSRRRLATGGVGLLTAMLAYHVVFGHNGMVAYQQKRAEYKQLEQQIQQLQGENGQLSDRIKALKSDPQAIEKEAREQLRYTRPGEVVYVLPADKGARQPTTASATAKP